MAETLEPRHFFLAGRWRNAAITGLFMAFLVVVVGSSTDSFLLNGAIVALLTAVGIAIGAIVFRARITVSATLIEIVADGRRLKVPLASICLDRIARLQLPERIEQALEQANDDNDGEIRLSEPHYTGDWVNDPAGRRWFVVRTASEGIFIPTTRDFDLFVTPRDLDGFLGVLRVRARLAQGARSDAPASAS